MSDSVPYESHAAAPLHPHIGRAWWFLVAGWLIAVGVCCWLLWDYSAQAGEGSKPPTDWPTAATVRPFHRGHTLVMLVHPHCPCSFASLTELASTLRVLEGRLQALVLFAVPKGVPPQWHQTELRERAESLAGVVVIDDLGGQLGRVFGAETSGSTLLYDVDGQLLFEGGLTPSRAHVGDSVGKRRVISLVRGVSDDPARSAVYGCELTSRDGP
ncbi:MAG: hypothetical protein ACI9MR_001871 [Myxococcota bacterium]|jgi:hypothetical protein